MPNPQLREATCKHCGAPIVWGTLQNGRNRSFDANPMPLADVAPADAYAYSRRQHAMVCLDGEPHPPAMVLRAHYCAAYRQARYDARLLGGIDQIGDLTDDLPIQPPTEE